MKKNVFFAASGIFALILVQISCTDNAPAPLSHPVSLDLTNNGSLDDVSQLGRVLFYDTHLSVNNSISCGSCHIQTLAFADNSSFSTGYESRLTKRNSMPIQNLGSMGFNFNVQPLFWDGREDFLQTMVLKPIFNHVEMGMSDENALVDRVRNIPYYSDLFDKAFKSKTVSAELISSALTSFVSRLTSSNTRLDRALAQQDQLTALEQQGQQLFFTKYNCNSCHQVHDPVGYENGGGGGFINIGLDLDYADLGRGAVTHDPADAGRFKIPSLRNVTLTAPYMHDGRFATLDAVIDHYSHGIANHPNLDPRLLDANQQAIRMNISSQEKSALIAFLGTLTDYSLISNRDFSNPFH